MMSIYFLLSTISFYYGDVVKPMFGEEELPKMPCHAVVSTDGKTPYFLYDRHRTGDFNFILFYGPLVEPILMEDQM